MKKVIATAMILGALLSSSEILASGKNTKPSVNPAKNMQVSFDNVNMDSQLTIKDSEDQILYTETIHSEGTYNRNFDMSALPSNEYYFEVDKKAFVSIYPFTVADNLVKLHKEEASEIVKPVLILENNRVKLMRNLEQPQTIKVEIYYQGQNLVFSETIEEDGMIGKVYDFSTSASGDYLFSIDYEDRSHAEYLSINTIY